MSERDWIQKVAAGQPLSEAEQTALTEALEADGVREVLRSLPYEEPSLAWRSRLNERLRALAGTQRKPAVWRWAAMFAAGAACGVMASLWIGMNRNLPVVDFEAALLAARQESVSYLEISAGSFEETEPGAARKRWSELDMEPL